MKFVLIALFCLSLALSAEDMVIYNGIFNDSQTESIEEITTTTKGESENILIESIHSVVVGFAPEYTGRLDLVIKMGDETKQLIDVRPGLLEFSQNFVQPTSVQIVPQAHVFSGVESTLVTVIMQVTFPGQNALAQPGKPFGNLPLRVQEYKNGKSIIHVGVANINHKGSFNAATYTAKTNGNVEIKLASANANGATREIVLFKKNVKNGETYLVNHPQIKSTGIFVLTTTVRGAKPPKNAKAFPAGVISYAVVK